MPEFYIVPPRLIVGSFDRAAVVNSINSLRGDLTITADTVSGAKILSSGNNIQIGFIPNYYVKRSGDTITGNIQFVPSGTNYGLAVASLPSNPATGATGGFYFNTTENLLKLYYNNSWNDIPLTALTSGIANTTYLRLDGTNTPTGNISMGSQLLRLANLATQVTPGIAGQIFFNTDNSRVQVYDGSIWRNVGLGITQINVGNGISSTQNPIVSLASISVDETANFTWTGNHIFNQPVTFGAAGQTFALNKLFIGGQTQGDIITYNSGSWARQGIGSSFQVLQVNSASTGIGWTKVTGIVASDTTPSNPINADLWWNSEDGSLNIYYQDGDSSQWVEIVNAFIGIGNTGAFDPYSDIVIYSNTDSTLTTNGALEVAGGVGIGKTTNIGGNLNLWKNSFFTGFKSAATASTTYTLPPTSPTATGTSVLASTQSGVMSWVPLSVGNSGASGTVDNGTLNSIPYYYTAGTSVTGSSNFINVGTGISILYTANSINPNTGALVVLGGVGIGGTINSAKDINIRSGSQMRIYDATNTYASGFKFTGSGQDYIYTLPPSFPSGAGTSILTSSASGVLSWIANKPTFTKSISILNPNEDDTFIMFRADRNLTISNMTGLVRGNSNPSVTYKVMYGSDRSAVGSTVVIAGSTTTSTTTGDSITSFNNSTPSTNDFVWAYITGVAGTVDEFHLSLFFG